MHRNLYRSLFFSGTAYLFDGGTVLFRLTGICISFEPIRGHLLDSAKYGFAGTEVEEQISVTVGNLEIALQVENREERAWIIRRVYNHISISVVNSGEVPVARYTVTRRNGNGAPESIRVISPAEMQSGQFSFDDMAVDRSTIYTYTIVAATSDGKIVGRSPAVTR